MHRGDRKWKVFFSNGGLDLLVTPSHCEESSVPGFFFRGYFSAISKWISLCFPLFWRGKEGRRRRRRRRLSNHQKGILGGCIPPEVATEASIENRGIGTLASLECLAGIIRALSMGSCLSSDWGGGGLSKSPSSSPRLCSKKAMKKRKGSSRYSSSGSIHGEDHLQRIPGRMFLNGASSVASLYSQQGKKGTNQDAMIVWENFDSRKSTVFCGVFDGHGPYGHMVSRRVRDSLPLKLSAQWEVSLGGDDFKQNSLSTVGSIISEETASLCLEDESRTSFDLDEEKLPEDLTALKDSLLEAFKFMDRELKLHQNIDCFCSGTTAVTLVKQGQDLVIGNVGDSRAVLGTRDSNDCLVAVQLTVDLKPNLPKEAERIKRHRGRVFALEDEPEVARIWLPNNDTPGLAMARAFGDFCLKDFGLISIPDISYRRICENDEFIVLATDGIWDVLSNEEVVGIVASAPSRSSAARFLVEHAVRAWKFKYPTSKIDDCAVVCLFLNTDDPRTKTIPSMKEASVADCGKAEDAEDWSALEGVTRVNTLLTLPRFVQGHINANK